MAVSSPSLDGAFVAQHGPALDRLFASLHPRHPELEPTLDRAGRGDRLGACRALHAYAASRRIAKKVSPHPFGSNWHPPPPRPARTGRPVRAAEDRVPATATSRWWSGLVSPGSERRSRVGLDSESSWSFRIPAGGVAKGSGRPVSPAYRKPARRLDRDPSLPEVGLLLCPLAPPGGCPTYRLELVGRLFPARGSATRTSSSSWTGRDCARLVKRYRPCLCPASLAFW